MRQTMWLALRSLRRDRGRTVLLCLTAALAAAGLFVILSFSVGYLRYFREQAALLGKDPAALAWQGILDVTEMMMGLLYQFMFGNTIALNLRAGDLFSAEAAVKNLPGFILLADLAALVAVRCAMALVFSAWRKRQRHFYSSLLVAGANLGYVRRCAMAEAACVCALSAPAAAVFGTAELLALRRYAADYFSRAGIAQPVTVRGSLLCALAAALAVALMAARSYQKTCRGLSVQTAAQDARRQNGVLLGIRAISSDPVNYRVLGLPHYVALRNIEDHLGRYLMIFLMTTVYLSVVGICLFILTLARNSGAAALTQGPVETAFYTANRFFFTASAAVTQVIATAGTVFGMVSNIDSNTQEYVLLRSAGASSRTVRWAARHEGALCVVVGVGISCYWLVIFVNLFILVYDQRLPGGGLDFSGVTGVLAVLGGFVLLFIASVAVAVAVACHRTRRIDMLKELKELAYG